MKISVIVPVYNGHDTLFACLNSLLNQTYSDYEILVINDGSTDDTESILAQFGNRIRWQKTENHGQAHARNVGLDLACGEYVAFVDADDRVKNNYLSELAAAAELYRSDVVLCFIQRIFMYKPNLLEKNFKYDEQFRFENPIDLSSEKAVLTKVINAPFAKLIKTSFLKENNIRFPEGLIYEDLYFTQKLLACMPKIACVNQELYFYQVRKNSTMTNRRSSVKDIFTIFDRLKQVYIQKNITETFKEELDYLLFYHIGIGTLYRMTMMSPLSFFQNLKICRAYLKRCDFHRDNRYIREKGCFFRFYCFLFYSFL